MHTRSSGLKPSHKASAKDANGLRKSRQFGAVVRVQQAADLFLIDAQALGQLHFACRRQTPRPWRQLLRPAHEPDHRLGSPIRAGRGRSRRSRPPLPPLAAPRIQTVPCSIFQSSEALKQICEHMPCKVPVFSSSPSARSLRMSSLPFACALSVENVRKTRLLLIGDMVQPRLDPHPNPLPQAGEGANTDSLAPVLGGAGWGANTDSLAPVPGGEGWGEGALRGLAEHGR